MTQKRVGPLSLWLSMLLLSLPGCASGGVEDDFGESTEAIIDGAPHDGDPATVYLMNRGSFSCTGSLIAPRVVLTARHCVDSGGGIGPASAFSVGTGPRADGRSVYARVQEVRSTRGGTFEGNDIAVLLLTAAGALTPYEVSYAPPRAGDPIVGVGYGQIEGWSRGLPGGRKYRGATTIGSVSRAELQTARPLPCYGDSGGPLFDAGGRVIGVVSRGTASTCEGGRGVYTRVDAHRELIDRAIADTGGAAPPPAPEPPPAPPPAPEPRPDPGTIDICAAPFEDTIEVGETLRFGCNLPVGRVVRVVLSAPQSIRSTLSIEDRTYLSTDAVTTYTFRARPVPTAFSFAVVGSNRFRPMPIRIEMVR